ncbi:MAG TPA: VWA domain-containing protein [Actinocatenispora sp.]
MTTATGDVAGRRDGDGTAVLVGFVRAVRAAGVPAEAQRTQAMLAAVDALGAADPRALYWAGRLTLCGEPDDLARYDAAFAAYFGASLPRPAARQARTAVPRRPALGFDAGTTEGEPDQTVTVRASASATETLRHRDVATLTDAERAEVRRLVALLAPATAPRRSRRYRPAARGELDPAGTVRAMLRAGGEPLRLARHARRTRPRRLVLLIDVSGSMAPYADALLRFAHAAVRRRPTGTEVFTLGTRLTRITRPLRARDPDVALTHAGRAIPDWRGGTRLGETLRAFLDRWGQRGTARQAVVVLASDGWERGDPALLGEQMARLSRLAYRVVWVNPHAGRAGYEPLTGGMVAASPHLDAFVAGHSLAALTELVGVIGNG